MKLVSLAAVSGFALIAILAASPAGAQGSYPAGNGDRVDANGMPTTHSTPEEHAQTAEINNAVAASNAAADAQASANDARYQAQQQNYEAQKQAYQNQQQQYQRDLDRHAVQQERYRDRTAMYEALRDRYHAERSAYHRGLWPDRYSRWVIVHYDPALIGQRVAVLSGNRVGTVIDVAHAPNGDVEALLVRLDNDKVVWIDRDDVRYDRADGVVMTNLDGADLRHMADERA